MKSPDAAVDPTLTASNAPTIAQTEPARRESAPRLAVDGYEVGQTLGKGGMGEVLLARDQKIGRNVAIKRMRDTGNPDAMARFLREAKIQARLDHPAIVPVHELGEDASGSPYFTMKRLTGRTLHDVLGEASQQQMLRAFIDVCLAIEFAHARGVVHRDLKPTNIMLGDYGEVYVLDWGIARVLAEHDDAGAGAGDVGQTGDITTLEGAGQTQVGALLGTPGYMSPEQVRGEEVGRPTDVYALGCILFEVLAGEPLHPRGTAALAMTLSRPSEAPGKRHPDRQIAPELDAATTAALAESPTARPTARELADRVQRYLDGDRDLERRRILAEDFLKRAREAERDPQRRAETIQLAGRALALDPGSAEAAELVTRLMIEPPEELPADLVKRISDVEARLAARNAGTAMYAMLAYFMFIPIVLWVGVKNWPLLAAIYALILLIVAAAWKQASGGRATVYVALGLNSILMLMFSRILSPFMFVPGVIGAFTVALLAQPGLIERPLLVIAMGLASFLTPVGLEELGVFERTWHFDGHSLVLTSPTLDIGGTATVVFLVVANIALVLVNGLFGRAIAGSRRHAHRQLEVQAWQLRKLLPVEPPSPELPPLHCETFYKS